jgi:Na+/H+ antiporter NhaD/arsenite permease-like protein
MSVSILALLSVCFAGTLLSIAIMPMHPKTKHKWEHGNVFKAKVMLAWALPVLVWLVTQPLVRTLDASLDYVGFISVLVPFYMVCSSISLEASYRPTPATNVFWMGLGSLFAILVGTMGATIVTMMFLRKLNENRRYRRHTWLFVITTVSNLGGLILAVGPPLFLPYQKGLAFEWFIQMLTPYWVLIWVLQMSLYYVVETINYRAEGGIIDENGGLRGSLMVVGGWNLLILCMMTLTVYLGVPHRVAHWVEHHGIDAHEYPLKAPVELSGALILWVLAALAYWGMPGSKKARKQNDFSWGPAMEVVVLFAGIFVTMIPTLMLLSEKGSDLGLRSPLAYFYVTGGLSGVLDNAPTLLCLMEVAKSTFGTPEMKMQELAERIPLTMVAMCIGAVTFGAATYIGNAPNFLVRSLADQGLGEDDPRRMYSFPLHMLYSFLILFVTVIIPVTIILQCGGLPPLW